MWEHDVCCGTKPKPVKEDWKYRKIREGYSGKVTFGCKHSKENAVEKDIPGRGIRKYSKGAAYLAIPLS